MLMLETHLREVVSKVARSLGVMRRERTLFDCPRVVKSCYNTYVLFSRDYCAPVWMSSEESHLGLLDNVVRSEEKLCGCELCCLGLRRNVSALCLLYVIYHREDHPMNEYLHFLLQLVVPEVQSLWMN